MLAGARVPGDCGLGPDAGHSLYPLDLGRHGVNVRWMSCARGVQLLCCSLLVEKLVQLAERFTARGRETRLFFQFLPVHFDAGDRIDHFVGCCSCVHSCFSFWSIWGHYAPPGLSGTTPR